MHYLIDGHNLIAKMPDISLDDPNDEMKLILRLKSWAAGSKKRRITVIFDGGLPGGKSLRFSNSSVKVVFASIGKQADDLLIQRIQKAKNPQEYTLISSDQEIIEAANQRRLPSIKSELFAANLEPEKGTANPGKKQKPSPAEDDNPSVSANEVEEWLALFGPVPERKPPQPKVKPGAAAPASKNKSKKASRHKPLAIEKRSERKLDTDEVDDWLDFFNSGKH